MDPSLQINELVRSADTSEPLRGLLRLWQSADVFDAAEESRLVSAAAAANGDALLRLRDADFEKERVRSAARHVLDHDRGSRASAAAQAADLLAAREQEVRADIAGGL